jgi:hypothetical protein
LGCVSVRAVSNSGLGSAEIVWNWKLVENMRRSQDIWRFVEVWAIFLRNFFVDYGNICRKFCKFQET